MLLRLRGVVSQFLERTRGFMKNAALLAILAFWTGCCFAQANHIGRGDEGSTIALGTGWSLQSSDKVAATGEVISTPNFQTSGWYSVTVPTTVVAALVAHKVYPDPTFGMNLRLVPGMTYP